MTCSPTGNVSLHSLLVNMSLTSNSQQWYERLGHVNVNTISKQTQNGTIEKIDIAKFVMLCSEVY